MEWIQIALENGGKLEVNIVDGYFVSEMKWNHRESVKGKPFGYVGSSLNSLDTELANDAAEEMLEAGVC